MKQYEDIIIEIVSFTTDVIRTSGPGDRYEEDLEWGV